MVFVCRQNVAVSYRAFRVIFARQRIDICRRVRIATAQRLIRPRQLIAVACRQRVEFEDLTCLRRTDCRLRYRDCLYRAAVRRTDRDVCRVRSDVQVACVVERERVVGFSVRDCFVAVGNDKTVSLRAYTFVRLPVELRLVIYRAR